MGTELQRKKWRLQSERWQAQNPGYYARVAHRNSEEWWKIVINKFGDGCMKCGYNKCRRALDLHHVLPSNGEVRRPFSTIMKTRPTHQRQILLESCILICANCHREIHDERR